ncbi:MAG: SDR family oxidoreductase [Bacteroidota bacterium]
MTLLLAGRVALVTGASRGIGRRIAEALAEEGASVVITSRSRDDLNELRGTIERLGGNAMSHACDLTQPDDIGRLVDATWSWRERIDVLVNAAGTTTRADELQATVDDWDTVFDLNVRAPFFLSQAVAKRMLTSHGGAIVNIASLAAEAVTGATAPYGASKAALVQLTRVLAIRWAPQIRVNAVGPGYVETDLNRSWLSDQGNRDWVVGNTPLGRLGDPTDISSTVVFLVAPGSAFITGQHVLVDGGWSAR